MTANSEAIEKKIINLLYNQGMIKTWYRDKPEGWTLVSNLWSPFYINLRTIGSKKLSYELLSQMGQAMGKMIKEELPDVTKLVGVYLAGIPIATAITIASGIPSCFTRCKWDKYLEKYGQHEVIEGDLVDGDRVAIVDDVVTTFNTKLEVKKQICEAAKKQSKNVSCSDVVVLLDREQGANEAAKANDMRLFSLIPFKTKGIIWLKDKMEDIEYSVITDYLQYNAKYQEKKLQEELRSLALKE